jgi:hydroxymethylbilane synthase
MSSISPLKLGTRASALARWQAEWVAARLQSAGHAVELVPISTQGDRLRGALTEAGGTGYFTRELQQAVLDGRIDLAVHSLKDLPTEQVVGLTLASVPERESVHDVLLSREGHVLAALPAGAVIGTGSLRRRAQLLHQREDLQTADIRGNVDTRIRKMQSGEFDAIVLAEAGLKRLGLITHATQIFRPEEMLPAVGQGALGIEIRQQDTRTAAAVSTLDDAVSHAAVVAERSLLATLRGGCLAPVGAWARIAPDGQLYLEAVVLSPEGRQRIVASGALAASLATQLGEQVGQRLLALGAAELIGLARG